jgi:hypothetical protein
VVWSIHQPTSQGNVGKQCANSSNGFLVEIATSDAWRGEPGTKGCRDRRSEALDTGFRLLFSEQLPLGAQKDSSRYVVLQGDRNPP